MGIYFDQNNKMVFDCRDGAKVMNSNCDSFVLDIDGNRYNYVTIGTQKWITSNLKVTHYSDGSVIPNVTNHSDWFLPSKDELNEMRNALVLYDIGNLDGNYGTSSEYDVSNNWVQYMVSGLQGGFPKSNAYQIRPIRTFTNPNATYSVRDVGPAGGWIFYITGSTYYEAAPCDVWSGTLAFSNVTDRAIGTTGTAIGTGSGNTISIIAQSGHTVSAAIHTSNFTGNNAWSGLTDGAYCWYNNAKDSTSDWFLPSKDELQKMYDELKLYGIGDFATSSPYYASSSEVAGLEANNIWDKEFDTGSWGTASKSAVNLKLRPCRYFTINYDGYTIRDVGPSGGWIFERVDNGNGTFSYYEAKSSDVTAGIAWSNVTSTAIGTTSTSFGEGINNTAEIIAQVGHTNSLAKLANDLVVTGYKDQYGGLYNWHAVNKKFDDWFLPSSDELDQMYNNLYLYGVGGFDGTSYYWSSSEYDATTAYSKYFPTGSDGFSNKWNPFKVRGFRVFTSSTSYSLRDVGPAGGWIFYISGTTYYEASPSELLTHVWSNVTGSSVGSTSTAVGTGISNTGKIIAQSSHIDSAAKLCTDHAETQKLVYFTNETGWRIPTQNDYSTLSSYLGGDSVSGGHLKETGTTHWTTPNTGADNTSQFSAIAAGYRLSTSGVFSDIGNYGFHWASTDLGGSETYILALYYNQGNGYPSSFVDKKDGISVRCVKDV